tara:strand:+ start:17112 stop:17726 length:615 start_codon:yes stop_codon:yes gene_type:complete
MASLLEIHPQNPQMRLIEKAVEQIRKGAVVIYPTDSSYAIGCHMGDKAAQDRIRQIRRLSDKHDFTLMCHDLSQASEYATFDKSTFRMLKAHTPGPFTFLLQAGRAVPKRLVNPKRKTIGIRLAENPIVDALLAELHEPMMSVTMQLPDADWPIAEVDDIPDFLEKQVDIIIDGGHCGTEPTTVVDLQSGEPVVIRQGRGLLFN